MLFQFMLVHPDVNVFEKFSPGFVDAGAWYTGVRIVLQTSKKLLDRNDCQMLKSIIMESRNSLIPYHQGGKNRVQND